MKQVVVIVAGGSGTRMEAEVPKQFLMLQDQPILMHTIDAFHAFNEEMEIILVLPEDQISYWTHLCNEYHFMVSHRVVYGGKTRFHSVQNGLSAITDPTTVIAIHDGVRPLVSHETISNCFDTAFTKGNAIPVVDPIDSLREVTNHHSRAVIRANFKLVQTPQVFKYEIIQAAYKQDYMSEFTDDASVIESSGYGVNLVDGNRENIKITSKTDLLIAEAFFNYNQ